MSAGPGNPYNRPPDKAESGIEHASQLAAQVAKDIAVEKEKFSICREQTKENELKELEVNIKKYQQAYVECATAIEKNPGGFREIDNDRQEFAQTQQKHVEARQNLSLKASINSTLSLDHKENNLQYMEQV